MNDNKKTRAPKLRFPGFTDDWEQRKLIDLLNQPITDGPHETPNLVEKGIPFISADAIVDNRIDFSRKRGFITEEYDLQCRKKYGPELYDVYLVKSGSTVGKVAIVETTKQFNIWSPLAAMRCKGKTNPYFLYFLFQTKENQNQVKSKASNGTQPNLSMRELEQFNVQISPLHDEQQKIGAFFKQLDSLITLQQRKIEHLKEKKKGLLQKMFPKNGESIPELRFPGFTEAWEQHKLGEVAEVIAGGDIDKSKIKVTGKFPVIANALTDDGIVGYYDNDFRVEAPAVTVTGRGEIGHARARTTNFTPVVRLLSIKSQHDVYFLENAINRKRVIVESTGVPQLTVPQLKNYKILFTNTKEEKQIGSFFKQLDTLIALQQRKLEHLELLKKGLLQQMFI